MNKLIFINETGKNETKKRKLDQAIGPQNNFFIKDLSSGTSNIVSPNNLSSSNSNIVSPNNLSSGIDDPSSQIDEKVIYSEFDKRCNFFFFFNFLNL
jgi:hypothetical protein